MTAFIQYTLQGLAAGGFYALVALGLAVIFGMLGVVNFAHGAFYMLGACRRGPARRASASASGRRCCSCRSLMFVFGVLLERLLVRWLLRLDPLYNFLLTFGLDAGPRRPGQAPVRRLRACPTRCPRGSRAGVELGRRRPVDVPALRLGLLGAWSASWCGCC